MIIFFPYEAPEYIKRMDLTREEFIKQMAKEYDCNEEDVTVDYFIKELDTIAVLDKLP